MASAQAEAIKGLLAAAGADLGGGDTEPTVEEVRAAGEGFAGLTGEPTGVRYEPVDAGGVPAEWAVPDGADSTRAVLYLHGGGYVIGSIASHRKVCGHLAVASGCQVLNVDYRLAPEHPHPAPVQDAVTAYRWLLTQGLAPSRVAVSGDSAGGGLTMALVVALRDAGDPLPASAVTFSPWVDLEGVGATMSTKAGVDLIVSEAALGLMARRFLQGQDPRTPLAAPLYADLGGLPPLYIQVGADETLLDDSVRLAAKAGAAGVSVRLEVFPEMWHVFQMTAGTTPEADAAVAEAGAFIRRTTGA